MYLTSDTYLRTQGDGGGLDMAKLDSFFYPYWAEAILFVLDIED